MARFNYYIGLAFCLSLGVLLMTSCSTQPKTLSPCEKKLSKCQIQLKSEQQLRGQCQQNIKQLNTRLGQLEKHLEECKLSAAEDLNRQQTIQSREAHLRQLLEQELRDKNVEIDSLKGRLTVRMLNRIMFDSGSAEILASGKQVLDKLQIALIDSGEKIRVEGHTDNVKIGANLSNKYPSNWELSAARASSVVRYFNRQHKIDAIRMEAVGLSKYHPLTTNNTEQERQRNRRVEIILTALD